MINSIKHSLFAMTALVMLGFCALVYSPTLVHADSKITDEPLLVHISTNDSAAVEMALMFASNMLNQGKTVTAFLDVKGVVVAMKNPPSELTPFTQKVRDFLNEGGRVIVCGHCMGASGFKPNDLLPGTEVGNPGKMSRLFSGHMAIISY
jgi:predicted peroxiredoxin